MDEEEAVSTQLATHETDVRRAGGIAVGSSHPTPVLAGNSETAIAAQWPRGSSEEDGVFAGAVQ